MSSPPQTLGQYQIIREIARSNDIVYEAYDPQMNRRVAVKELSMPSGSTPQQLEDRISRFRREAQAVGSLNHPNIMTVFSFAEDNGRYFMAMEYLDGITLRKEMDNSGFLTPDRAVEIITGVLEGLYHAHNEGVVHRDIKPDNIQITSNNGIKITDFGIARLTFQPNLTMDGQVFGTPSYMSPEQVVGKDIDQRTDLFSVGVMLYEMLTGNKPFQGDNVIAITHAIVNATPPPTTQISNPMWQVITRSLEKAPQMRYHNAAEMRQALQDAFMPAVSHQSPVVGFDPYSQPPQSLIQSPNGQPSYPAPDPYAPPMQTPYGGVIPQQYNPYGQQMAAPPVIAPPTYGSYNPYGQPMQQPYQPPQAAPYNVYYPPQPSQPLISQEARERMRQVVLAIILFGVIAAILVAAFVTLTNSIQSQKNAQQSSGQDNRVSTTPGGGSSSTESASGNGTTGSANAPGGSVPNTSADDLRERANNESTDIGRAESHMAAGEAYAKANNNLAAYDEFLAAYNYRLKSGASRPQIREALYRMKDMTQPDTEARRNVENLIAEFNSQR